MFAIYSLLLTLGFLALLPRFLYDAFRRGKYVSGFRERLGTVTPLSLGGQPVIWLHCVSVGETQAARPLVRRLHEEFPNHQIVVSTITLTGQTLAREVFRQSAAKVFYFPFDWGFSASRSLSRINPAAVLLMETEIWPGFIRTCHRRGIPVLIVNGRISERSFRRYRLVRPFMSRVLSMVDIAVMQSDEDAERIQELGLDADKVFSSGNLKFDVGHTGVNQTSSKELETLLGSSKRPLIVAASTHSPEEKILLDAFRRIRESSTTEPCLLIAPRHPERFNDVASSMAKTEFAFVRRSENRSAADADLILLDSIGELPAAYEFASVVFVGGSIAKKGGHNILEPAAIGSCIVTGAYTFNFASIVRKFLEEDALVQLPPLSEADAAAEVADVFARLLNDPARREKLKQKSRAVVQENIGATERTVKFIGPLLGATNPPTQDLAPGSHSLGSA